MRPESSDAQKLFSYYSDVKEKEVDWLWYPYIPYGKITLIEGDPGEGKSTFMLHIAALLTQGYDMPDGYSVTEPINVIYQCPEDDISDTIKPRLLSAGADCSRVAYIIDGDSPLTLEDRRIEAAIEQTGAKLVILDPLQSFLSQDSDIHNAGRMRALLGHLAVMAARKNCAVVLIGHMNKSNGNKTLYRGLGSIDISAIARSILMVARDIDTPTARYMFPIKTSLAPEGPAIGFRFDREKGFRWIGICNANVRVDSVTSIVSRGKRADCTDYVISLLQDGPMASAEIIERLSMRGVSERTIYALKKDAGIISYKKNKIWFWKLSDEGSTKDV